MATPTQRGRWFFFDDGENVLVEEVLSLVAGRDGTQGEIIQGDLERLGRLARLVEDCPSIRTEHDGRIAHRPAEALIDLLCRVRDYDFQLHIPTKAVLGQGYLVAKINFLKSLDYALDAVEGPKELRARAQAEVGQSIYSKMAEELLIAIITERGGVKKAKLNAGRQLFYLWEDRLLAEVDDVAPVLEAAWSARATVRPVFGTMLGTQEVFQLFQACEDDSFVSYYVEQDLPNEEVWSFEEFIFGLSFEEIGALRKRTETEGTVTEDDARGILRDTTGMFVFEGLGPQAQYASYQRRRVNARSRVQTSRPGPKKAAEEYLMIARLLAS